MKGMDVVEIARIINFLPIFHTNGASKQAG